MGQSQVPAAKSAGRDGLSVTSRHPPWKREDAAQIPDAWISVFGLRPARGGIRGVAAQRPGTRDQGPANDGRQGPRPPGSAGEACLGTSAPLGRLWLA